MFEYETKQAMETLTNMRYGCLCETLSPLIVVLEEPACKTRGMKGGMYDAFKGTKMFPTRRTLYSDK
jgi:hypothetical protein